VGGVGVILSVLLIMVFLVTQVKEIPSRVTQLKEVPIQVTQLKEVPPQVTQRKENTTTGDTGE